MVSVMKTGYKQTEIGVIPEDWEVSPIGNVCEIVTGNKNTQDKIEDGQYPFFVRSQTIEHINSYSFDCEGVLTAGDGVGTGKVFHYINGKFDFHQRVYLMNNFTDKLNGFFFYLHFSNNFYARIMQMTAKSSVDSVRREMIADMKMPIPPLKEQTAIAAALSDVDALMGELDKLIAKKRDIKQATMQQLLTGKKRLAGFSGEWEVTNLGAVCNESMQNGVFFKPSNKGFGIKIINVGDLYKVSPIDIDSLELFNANNSEKERFSVKDGDLFFTRSSVVPSGIAHCNMYQSNQDELVVFDSHVIRVRPNKQKIISSFLFRFCISSIARNYLISHAKTGTMTTIDQNVLAKCPVYLPSIEEQTAIATILSDMDADISQLEARRTKTAQLKQGMMQELLTGRIRLNPQESTPC